MIRFEVGDRVRVTSGELYSENSYTGLLEYGDIGTVTTADDFTCKLNNEGRGCNILNKCLVKVEQEPTRLPHKHAELIKAWADGADIQMYSTGQLGWHDLEQPSWSVGLKYRIKPTKTNKEIKLEEMEETARKLAEEIKAFRDE